MLRKVGLTAAAVIVVLAAVTFGPAVLRRDVVSYRWDGVIGEGMLAEPIGIAYAAGRLFVSDAASNRVVIFDTIGTVLDVWGDSTLTFHRPMHLSLGPDRLLRVAEYLSDRVSVIDSAGTVLERVGGVTGSGSGELDAPGGAAALGSSVFVADFYNHRVQVFGSAAAQAIGRPGRLFQGRLHYPTDVATDDSLVYVADAYNHRIQVFHPSGEYVRRWGGPFGLGVPAGLKGWFNVATGIEVAGGRVYVADFYNDRVQIFNDSGQYIGQAADSLALPTDIAIAGSDELYVVDFGHQRVVRFRVANR